MSVTSSNAAGDSSIELSIVMPCLNEKDTLGTCIQKAQRALAENNIVGEVIVADNGSTDGSIEIATRLGARVVPIAQRGYGNALMGGIAAAKGKYVLMGDADDSYDFLQAPRFLEKLREGFDLVQGCRLPSGGGTIMKGAMPLSHRLLGNPALSTIAHQMFFVPVHDIYCGMRAFNRELIARLDLRCTGMEYATEMIIKASLYSSKIAEIPITLHPDGRISGRSHLRTIRDGWRTLRFFLLLCPRWLFLYPGVGLILAGMAGYAIAMPRMRLYGVTFDAHTLLVASLAILLGYQAVLFAIFAKTFAISERLLPEDPLMTGFYRIMNLERGVALGLLSLIGGAVLLVIAVNQWLQTGLGPLDYSKTMRFVVPGTTLVALGFQTILSSFFVSILGMKRK